MALLRDDSCIYLFAVRFVRSKRYHALAATCRPTIMGESGVRHVMKSLLADFDILICVGGFKTVEEIDANCLETYPKIYSLPQNSNL
ncbi:hypothetical protein V1527DRAFT_474319 [Lipomyces starkeyi]